MGDTVRLGVDDDDALPDSDGVCVAVLPWLMVDVWLALADWLGEPVDDCVIDGVAVRLGAQPSCRPTTNPAPYDGTTAKVPPPSSDPSAATADPIPGLGWCAVVKSSGSYQYDTCAVRHSSAKHVATDKFAVRASPNDAM